MYVCRHVCTGCGDTQLASMYAQCRFVSPFYDAVCEGAIHSLMGTKKEGIIDRAIARPPSGPVFFSFSSYIGKPFGGRARDGMEKDGIFPLCRTGPRHSLQTCVHTYNYGLPLAPSPHTYIRIIGPTYRDL